ncbi:TetR family transcriptional regulator [Asanoa ishikariensis]|uniref:Transcriptional regulator, TetR family n=1 Tax=Asanoa ishikariensis TaxID=137265 RepID=A0A1H3UBD3_9ACTN|nr:TetR family transcriptional regulator [Asanoa ishikariensis]GIF63904.1 TetR family transcriptional regulator [Asanoa ishikariensis]SDZ59780.1 transcriptional regulator, TetR family [Asanoa ishikariensis]
MTSPRRRDAAGTRRLLLEAARRRFARNGYAATTVRDIADEAGVNVALINRYFASKEGLFEACLQGVGNELGDAVVGVDQVPRIIARQLSGAHKGEHPNQLLLLLRSSGDERAEEIRLGILRSFAERMAAAGNCAPGNEDCLLRAQVLLSAALGLALLRSTTTMEPLTSADEHDLLAPLQDLFDALLPGR